MNQLLFDFIIALIPFLGAVVVRYVVPYIKGKIGAQQLALIMEWTNRAVLAAEVLFKASNSGNEKREYVIDFINKKFNEKKVIITEDQIRILLEACWKEAIADAKAIETAE